MHIRFSRFLGRVLGGAFTASHPDVKPSISVRDTGQDNLLVFVHGVLSGADVAWRNAETGAYWPDLITRDADFKDFDVSAVNYESPAIAGASTIEEIAQRVLQQLRDRDTFTRYKQIHFLTHSMGGLVVKRILVILNHHTDLDNLRRVRAVLYISTPAQGAPIADLARWLSLNRQFQDMKPADLNTFLQSLEDDWQALLRDRDATGALFPKCYCAYETKPTHGIMVVSRVYAATHCDNTPYAIDLDHVAISKPRSVEVDPYVWSKARLLEAAGRKMILQSLPTADPNLFAVAIAHLENDSGGDYEHLIVAALSELEGVQILSFNRTIALEGPRPQESIKAGHKEARQYLEASRAHLLIWGRVLKRDGKGVLQIYWTLARNIKPEKQAGHYDPVVVELPDVFWTDFTDILRLLVVSYDSEFRALDGRFVADRLGPFIARIRGLLADRQHERGWGAEARLQVKLILADSLVIFGDQTGQPEPLSEAVVAYRAALQEYTRERVPLDWALTQNNLGNALQRLGEREADTTHLEEAVVAYRAAVQEYTRERVPLDWALTQNNLGNALATLGEREADTAHLEEAVVAYRAALQERTRERVPLNWAMTQNNLGNALQRLGEREADTARLEEAVVAYRAALQERTRERAPLDWAMTQNNLGNALATLGERETDTARLEEAVVAYRAALQEYTRQCVPLDWAMTQNNLGSALATLGGRETDTAHLEEAVVAYRAVLQEYTRERVPLDWATTQNNLGNALRRLGEREADTARLEEAVVACGAALQEYTRERVPLNWAMTQNNLGNALRSLGEREADTARLEEAVVAYRAALQEYTRERVPLNWAMTQNNLGNALRRLGERETDTARLEEAVVAYRAALQEYTRERVPLNWAITQNNLGNALATLGERQKEP